MQIKDELKSVTIDIPASLVEEIEIFSLQNNIDKKEIFKDALNLYLDYQQMQDQAALTRDPNDRPLSHNEFFDGLDI